MGISGNPGYLCENKFHQYDSTCHFFFGNGWRNRRIQRFSLHLKLSFPRFGTTRCQSARRWCQIPWIFEESWKWSSRAGRLSKTFPEVPVSCRASCGSPESRLGIPHWLGILMGWRGTLQSCSQFQCLSQTKNSHCSIRSWIWVNNWRTVVGSLFWRKDKSSILACLARSV